MALLHVVLATRHDPPLPLARWRASGTVRELRFDELRFDTEELRSLLEHATGLPLDPEQVQRLHQRVEGWAVGAQLAASPSATSATWMGEVCGP